MSLIFETNYVKFSENLENSFIWKITELDNEKIAEIGGILGMHDARDNRAISVDHLSPIIICHLRPYFQCQLLQNNLKAEKNIKYPKLRKARDNNRLSGS